MDRVHPAAPQLADLVPYDPKYIPAEAMMSANENPRDVADDIRKEIERAIRKVPLNRYPDPLANELREMIAQANGLDRDWVLIGNGGDELLFNTAIAWGGPNRTYLNLPPTFSVYAANAKLVNTKVENIPRLIGKDFKIDENAVLNRVSDKFTPVDFTVIASPNNPTGELVSQGFLHRLLEATDALVMADEAYFEFSHTTARPLLESNENLVILRTFSKAFSLAGVRLGYILANPDVIREYIKVRQPYSVDAVSQAIGKVIYSNRSKFEPGIEQIVSERARVMAGLKTIPTVKAYPSDSNWILFKVDEAHEAWEYLYSKGILIRDFSSTQYLEGCLRVTIGLPDQNSAFLSALRDFVMRKRD